MFQQLLSLQPCPKLLVGESRQSILGFNHCEDALAAPLGPGDRRYTLMQSFDRGPQLAAMVNM